MAEDPLQFNPRWRERIADIGRQNFVREEMARLGFLPNQSPAQQQALCAFLERAYPRLRELRRELAALNAELDALPDLAGLLEEVRRLRIARVGKERAERRARRAAEQAQRRAADQARRYREPPFLGHEVSSPLTYAGGDAEQLAQLGLPWAANAEELAQAMALPTPTLLWLAYDRRVTDVDHYARFTIPKKTGGTRALASPKPQLRQAQAWIHTAILKRLTPHAAATAYRPGQSIVDHARPHCGQALVVRLDLKDFFPSITDRRVRHYFQWLGYNPGIATLLALLCTDRPRVTVQLDGQRHQVAVGERGLPQGALTSPALANLIATPLDNRLTRYLATGEAHWVYTRYADDLTFSTADPRAAVGSLLRAAALIIKEEGFRLNPAKTAVMRAPGRQWITGLLVDGGRIRLSREDRRRFRAFLHRCATEGLDAVSAATGKDALATARGYLAYAEMIMPGFRAQMVEQHPWLAEP